MSELLTFAGALKPPAAAPVPGAGQSPCWKTAVRVEIPRRLTATISADDVKYGLAEFRSVHATVTRSTGPCLLEQLSFRSLGGSDRRERLLSSRGRTTPSSSPGKTSGIDIQNLIHMLGSTRDAGGIADSEGHLVTGLGDRFLPAMHGTVKLDIKNGWTAMPGLLKVLSRLNISTLFSEVRGRHQQRLPYDEAHGSVTIVAGKVTTDKPILLQNKTLQMAFLGSYDLPTRTVDGRLVVNFLTVTDEIIGMIPGVRDILLGKERGLIPIWVKIKGKGSDPIIEILSAKTIAAPVWNTFKHILRLPKTLFEAQKPCRQGPPKPDLLPAFRVVDVRIDHRRFEDERGWSRKDSATPSLSGASGGPRASVLALVELIAASA